MPRRIYRFAVLASIILLGIPDRARATSIDFSKASTTIDGAGAILASYGFTGFTVSSSGTYTFASSLTNTTGTPQSPAAAGSFFDVFIELEVDGTTTPCGTNAVIAAGATFGCQITLSLISGPHNITTFVTMTFPNPLTLTAGGGFFVDEVVGNGPPVPVTPAGSGLGKATKWVIIGAVPAAGGVAAGVAGSGVGRVMPEPEPLLLVGFGCGVMIWRRLRRVKP